MCRVPTDLSRQFLPSFQGPRSRLSQLYLTAQMDSRTAKSSSTYRLLSTLAQLQLSSSSEAQPHPRDADRSPGRKELLTPPSFRFPTRVVACRRVLHEICRSWPRSFKLNRTWASNRLTQHNRTRHRKHRGTHRCVCDTRSPGGRAARASRSLS